MALGEQMSPSDSRKPVFPRCLGCLAAHRVVGQLKMGISQSRLNRRDPWCILYKYVHSRFDNYSQLSII